MGVGIYFWRLLRKYRQEMMVWRCWWRKRNDVKGYLGGNPVMELRQTRWCPTGDGEGALTEAGKSVDRRARDR